MHTLLKVLGWLLLVPGALLIVLIPFAAFGDGKDAVAGLIMLGGLFGLPGALLLRGGIKRQRQEELQDQMVGFVRTHEAFALAELAAHIGKTPAEAQKLLHADIARFQLPLVMHRASGRYMRLDRLNRAVQVAERCQSCGGVLANEMVFEGEQLSCPYCGSVVQTHAPVQASWNQAQGAWGQGGWGQPTQPQPAYHPGQHYGAQAGQGGYSNYGGYGGNNPGAHGHPPAGGASQGGPWNHHR